jgi:hypothetical protein
MENGPKTRPIMHMYEPMELHIALAPRFYSTCGDHEFIEDPMNKRERE